uniref:Chitin-binding type-2 domain-containing protein n=1 Tax=Anopheles epiroticus TaxID=199890 RepID=A0A182PID3_9DIPT
MKYIVLTIVLFACVHAEPGDMVPSHPNCPEVQGELPHYFIHPTNCSRFFECRRKDAWEFECPGGLHFNTAINVCDLPVHANEAAKYYYNNGSSDNIYRNNNGSSDNIYLNYNGRSGNIYRNNNESNNHYMGTDNPNNNRSDNHNLGSDNPNNNGSDNHNMGSDDHNMGSYHNNFECSGYHYNNNDIWTNIHPNRAGATLPNYWAHGSSCSKYYGCLENCVKEFKCPDGLYWNDQQKRCDSYSSSQCVCPEIPPAPSMWPTTTTVSPALHFGGN